MTHSMATHQRLQCLYSTKLNANCNLLPLNLNNESFQYDENIRMEEFLTHNWVMNI